MSHAHFFDLGDEEDGLALVRELVSRDWGSLSEDERDELVQGGYLALEGLRADYDPARCDRFRAYARTLLPLRLRDLAGRLHVREVLAEDEQLERLEFASPAERARLTGSRGAGDDGWFTLGRAPAESGTRARLEAETHWFGASSLAEVAAVHSGEGYRIHERGPGDELLSLRSQAPLVRGFQAELRLAVGEEARPGERALVEDLRAALASQEWEAAAETLVAIERLEAFAPAADMTAWLRSPAAPLGRTEALRIRRVVGVYSRGGIAAGELTGLSLQKLDCLVPAIRQGLLATEEAFALARSEPIRALQAKARLLRREA